MHSLIFSIKCVGQSETNYHYVTFINAYHSAKKMPSSQNVKDVKKQLGILGRYLKEFRKPHSYIYAFKISSRKSIKSTPLVQCTLSIIRIYLRENVTDY